MIAEEGKAGRKIGEKWSAIVVPSPAASHIITAETVEGAEKMNTHEIVLEDHDNFRSTKVRLPIPSSLHKAYMTVRGDSRTPVGPGKPFR